MIRAFTTTTTFATLSTLTLLDKDNNNEDTNNNSDDLDKYIDNNDTDNPHSFFSPIIIPMDPKIEGIHRLRVMINDCQPDILLVVGEYDLICMQEEVLENGILSSLASVKNERQQQTNNDNEFVVDVIVNNNSVHRVTAPSPPTLQWRYGMYMLYSSPTIVIIMIVMLVMIVNVMKKVNLK